MGRKLARDIALLAMLAPSALRAQNADPTVRHSLYFAFGGDVVFRESYEPVPLFASAGVERSRPGSRWSLRLGADYRRLSGSYAETRWEDFGLGLTARYARRSGSIRPYLLGGVGIADLRMRGRWVKYDEVSETVSGPVDSTVTSLSRWNASITPGVGTEVSLGRVRLFSEARLNFYPASVSNAPRPRRMRTTKALYIGVKL